MVQPSNLLDGTSREKFCVVKVRCEPTIHETDVVRGIQRNALTEREREEYRRMSSQREREKLRE